MLTANTIKKVIIIRQKIKKPIIIILNNLLLVETSKFSQLILLGLSTFGIIVKISFLYLYF